MTHKAKKIDNMILMLIRENYPVKRQAFPGVPSDEISWADSLSDYNRQSS